MALTRLNSFGYYLSCNTSLKMTVMRISEGYFANYFK